MISYDRIKATIHKHIKQVTPNCYAIPDEDALINDLDDMFAEAYYEGQQDSESRFEPQFHDTRY